MEMSRFKYFFEPQNGKLWEQLHNPNLNPRFFTASSVANLLGCGYESGAKEYDYRTAAKPFDAFLRAKNPAFEFGHKHEPDAIQSFYVKHPQFKGVKPGMILHPNREDMAASLDQITVNEKTHKFYNLEIKCKFNGEHFETPEQIPFTYLVQVTIQNYIAGLEEAILWVWTPQRQTGWLIPRDDQLMKEIESGVDRFIERLNTNKRPNRTKLDEKLSGLLTNLRTRIKSF